MGDLDTMENSTKQSTGSAGLTPSRLTPHPLPFAER